MSKVFFVFFAGIFAGAAIFELGKRAKSKCELICMLANLAEKEAKELFSSTATKDEKLLISDFQP